MTASTNNHVYVFTKKKSGKPVSVVSPATLKKAKEVAAKYAPTQKK